MRVLVRGRARARRLIRVNRWTLAVFASFCASIVLFALLYYAVYRGRPTSFAFNSDIVVAQQEGWRSRATARRERLRGQVASLELLEAKLRRNRQMSVITTFENPGDYNHIEVRVGQQTFFFAEGKHWPVQLVLHGGPATDLEVGDSKLRWRVGTFAIRRPTWAIGSVEDHLPGVQDLIRKLRGDMLQLSEKLTAAEVRDQWGFLDFLYFSAITATTVGYGDMLPNSTTIRVLVTLQVLVSSFMLAAVINFAVRRRRSRRRTA